MFKRLFPRFYARNNICTIEELAFRSEHDPIPISTGHKPCVRNEREINAKRMRNKRNPTYAPASITTNSIVIMYLFHWILLAARSCCLSFAFSMLIKKSFRINRTKARFYSLAKCFILFSISYSPSLPLSLSLSLSLSTSFCLFLCFGLLVILNSLSQSQWEAHVDSRE